MVRRFAEEVEWLFEKDEFSGSILITVGKHTIFSGAYGLACKHYDIPNKINTCFNIGSVGKMFTGISIAQLVESGRISFDDTVDRYIPEDWLSGRISKKIRIKHLLTHTSGLAEYFPYAYGQTYEKVFRNLEDYRSIMPEIKLDFEPGTCWSYSSTGFILLGVVVENIAGLSYYDYVNKNVFERAGMKSTSFQDLDSPEPNSAFGYYREETDGRWIWRCNFIKPILKGGPSGGCYSTVEDLVSFGQALTDHRLLSPDFTAITLSPKADMGSPGYGYGFAADGRTIGHSGDGCGISAVFRIYPKEGCMMAVLSNYGPPSAGNIIRLAEELVIPCSY